MSSTDEPGREICLSLFNPIGNAPKTHLPNICAIRMDANSDPIEIDADIWINHSDTDIYTVIEDSVVDSYGNALTLI
jgi:hypothetical protein